MAHPALAEIAKKVFDEYMAEPNQISKIPSFGNITAKDLLNVANIGTISVEGVKANLEVALRYTESWIRGQGCLAIHHLMEDAATAEVSRSQVWQWARHSVTTKEGVVITGQYNLQVLDAVYREISRTASPGNKFLEAFNYLKEIVSGKFYPDFITRSVLFYSVKYVLTYKWSL